MVRKQEGLDHRVLQGAHDKIAAYYRYAHDNGGQTVLPLDGLSHEQRLERDWRAYWRTEVARLTEPDDVFVRAG